MFDNFSMRARQVIFVTRLKAGRRGADALDIADLVSSIIVEDQDMIEQVIEGQMGRVVGLQSHPRFFSASSASDLLASLEGVVSRSNPIPDSADLPITADLEGGLQSGRTSAAGV